MLIQISIVRHNAIRNGSSKCRLLNQSQNSGEKIGFYQTHTFDTIDTLSLHIGEKQLDWNNSLLIVDSFYEYNLVIILMLAKMLITVFVKYIKGYGIYPMVHSILLVTRMFIVKSQSLLIQDKCVVIFKVSFPITRTCYYPGLFDTCAPMIVIRKWPDYVWHIEGVLVTRREEGRNMHWDAKNWDIFVQVFCYRWQNITKFH